MRLSIARVSADGDTARNDGDGFDVHGALWHRMPLALAVVLILGSIGIVFGAAKPAGRGHPVLERRSDRVGRQWNPRRLQPDDGIA